MTNEPDRPHRDVSIEEAQRMPMTDEELDAIEARAKTEERHGSVADPATVLALVAEVRRLRAAPPVNVSLRDGESFVAGQYRITMRGPTMVVDVVTP